MRFNLALRATYKWRCIYYISKKHLFSMSFEHPWHKWARLVLFRCMFEAWILYEMSKFGDVLLHRASRKSSNASGVVHVQRIVCLLSNQKTKSEVKRTRWHAKAVTSLSTGIAITDEQAQFPLDFTSVFLIESENHYLRLSNQVTDLRYQGIHF